jgi:hypothetical protein
MKGNAIFCGLFAGAGFLIWGTLIGRTEDMEPGQASGFSAVEYYPASQQIRVRTSGADGAFPRVWHGRCSLPRYTGY